MTRLFVLIALSFGFAGAAFAGCAGKLASASAQGQLTYSPFAAWNAQQTLMLTVQNTGTSPCAYQVSVPPAYYPLQFGGKISFSLSALGGAVAAANLTLTTPVIKPNQSAQLPIVLTIPRGQPSLSGYFISKLGFALTGAGAPAAGSPIDQAIMPLSCRVPPIFEINLAGSGIRSTVQFASLETGQKAFVILQTRTNGGHQIVFRSLNGGFLALNGLSGPASTISYVADVDGQPVTLTAPVALSFAAAPGEAARRLTVTVGDTTGKPAGTYTDVITVSILSSM